MDDKTEQVSAIRPCTAADVPAMLRIINTAAQAYRGVIPPDCWHEPYMPLAELQAEIAAGIAFTGLAVGGDLVGVMGLQPVRNVRLIRHAYVMPALQGRGVGSRLLETLRGGDTRPVLIGTWRAAHWAAAFYQRNGFALVPDAAIGLLLKTYWTVPDRQIATSVVLAAPPLTEAGAARLVAESLEG